METMGIGGLSMPTEPPEEKVGVTAVVNAPEFKEPPEKDKLAAKWQQRISNARKHYLKFHERCKHNRDVVAGFDWKADAKDQDFVKPRANLIHGTITGILPNLYAQNPEISVSPISQDKGLKLFCKTLETVTNRYLEDADLKSRAKSAVRSAMTCSIGAVKIIWQQDVKRDPLIEKQIQDNQDNLIRVEKLLMDITDDQQRADAELKKQELEQTIAGLMSKVETVEKEGLCIDRVMTENIMVDPAIEDFADYEQADWIAHRVPMKRSYAEGLFGYHLDKATTYGEYGEYGKPRIAEEKRNDDDPMISVYEIWDKSSQRVYTLAEGCDWFLREPYTPEATGERWYPFFLLPYQQVDGKFVGPSIVDLTEKLQEEHNKTRDKLNEHRALIRPGYVASAEVNEKTINSMANSGLGEITVVDTGGQNLNAVFQPKQFPPIDPNVYDVSQVRVDWEQTTGLQDAARSSITKAKTATEAKIMQQSLSARVSEFRDQIEDWIQKVAQYTAEILLLTLPESRVATICGKNEATEVIDPKTGQVSIQITKQSYDWQEGLPRDKVFDLVQLKIRAGTTGAPDSQEKQENWLEMVQLIQPMILNIMQLQQSGHEPTALINLLKETISRFDDRLELGDFVPSFQQTAQETQQVQQMQIQQQQQQAAQQAAAQGEMING